MKFIKVATFFIIVLIGGVAFVYFNISDGYPVDDACNDIRGFRLQHNRFPTSDELGSLIPKAKLFSVREYQTKNGDFLFYFCKTSLAPCLVCTNNTGPYWDEI